MKYYGQDRSYFNLRDNENNFMEYFNDGKEKLFTISFYYSRYNKLLEEENNLLIDLAKVKEERDLAMGTGIGGIACQLEVDRLSIIYIIFMKQVYIM